MWADPTPSGTHNFLTSFANTRPLPTCLPREYSVFGCIIHTLTYRPHAPAVGVPFVPWLVVVSCFFKCPPKKVAAPFDGRTEAAYAKYLDAQNQDRELLEQEKLSTERYLKRHHSVWMYFPHVELLFLLFAYQGASAAEARMIYSGCFPLVVLGLCALVRRRNMKEKGGGGSQIFVLESSAQTGDAPPFACVSYIGIRRSLALHADPPLPLSPHSDGSIDGSRRRSRSPCSCSFT